MPLGRLYIGEEKPLIIGWLSHDTLCQEGPGRIRVTGCGKNAEICTFLGPVLRPMGREIPSSGIGLSYTAFGRPRGAEDRRWKIEDRGEQLGQC